MAKFSRGSEWHKWDLHIHTPKSIIQDFGGDSTVAWDAYIKKLAGLPPEIKAIAITDYLFCDGYEYLLSRRAEIPNIELIFPNIEFRLNTFSGTPGNIRRHNFHIIFDPTVSIDDIKEQLLNGIVSGYKIEDNSVWQQTPTRRSLAQLGAQMKAAAPAGNTIHSKADLVVGFENITYDREALEELLQKTCFRGKFVTAIGYSEWDQSRWDQSASEKRTLINSCNFALTCLDDPAKIAENKKDLVDNNLSSLILHSSDAHDLVKLDKTLLWIKADVTFAGLKQVLNEPDCRVFIGDVPPDFKPDHQVISKIIIPASKEWFSENFEMDLNRDLVTIIGGRGSGKSALAEAIAYGAGSIDESGDSFLKKASKHKTPITGSEIILHWADGHPTQFTVGIPFVDQGLVQYLPQGAVEDLCSPQNSDKLQRQIENVIFQALDDTKRMGASDFEELRNRILENFRHEKEQVVKRVESVNQKLNILYKLLKGLPDKNRLLAEKKNELSKLVKSLPVLPLEDQKGQEELESLIILKKKFEDKIIELQNRLSVISQVETKLKIFKTDITTFETETNNLISSLNIKGSVSVKASLNETEINALLTTEKATVNQILKDLRDGSKSAVADILAVSETSLAFDNLQLLVVGIENKQRETKAFETNKLKYQQQKKMIADLENSIKTVETEIMKVNTDASEDQSKFEEERLVSYVSYFDLLDQEKEQIKELYKPLQDTLHAGTDTDKKLEFDAQVVYRLNTHHAHGIDLIDRTRRGNFRETENLKKALLTFSEEIARNNYDKEIIKVELGKLIELFKRFEEKAILIEDQLRSNYEQKDFFDWIFDPTNFEIASALKFDDTDLYLLSPGQKGIILLILYLEIDKGDYRPLIIDQPEENLDNFSIYKDLIYYFRERKQYRQIIMVTHNPNLVVNTDAEQVIIANYNGKRNPRLEYCAGSLEDQAKLIPDVPIEDLEDGIIERVCNVLEGGETAFEKRKKKYQISQKSKI